MYFLMLCNEYYDGGSFFSTRPNFDITCPQVLQWTSLIKFDLRKNIAVIIVLFLNQK